MTVLFTVLVVLAALGLSAGVGYPVAVWVLRRAERVDPVERVEGEAGALEDQDPPGGTGAADATGSRAPMMRPEEVLRGGTWIGILERLAITGAILAGYPAAIAVVIAVKGLGRFPELNTATGVSERFIIGTLASGLWAAAVGLGALWGLDALG